MCTMTHCPLHGQSCGYCLNNEEGGAVNTETAPTKSYRVMEPREKAPRREVNA